MKKLVAIVLVLGLAGSVYYRPQDESKDDVAVTAPTAQQTTMATAPRAVPAAATGEAPEIVPTIDAWLLLMLLRAGFLGVPNS